MEMNAANFKMYVDKMGGPNKVLSIIFNNAYRQVFTEYILDYEKHIDEDNEMFIFTYTDPPTKKIITIVKPIEYVEGITFVDTLDNIENMSMIHVAG